LSADFARETFCFTAADCGSEPRNIDGINPGAWIAPGPAIDLMPR
jgi:hypothetical protein